MADLDSISSFRERTRVQVLGKELGIRAKNEMFERWQVSLAACNTLTTCMPSPTLRPVPLGGWSLSKCFVPKAGMRYYKG